MTVQAPGMRVAASAEPFLQAAQCGEVSTAELLRIGMCRHQTAVMERVVGEKVQINRKTLDRLWCAGVHLVAVGEVIHDYMQARVEGRIESSLSNISKSPMEMMQDARDVLHQTWVRITTLTMRVMPQQARHALWQASLDCCADCTEENVTAYMEALRGLHEACPGARERVFEAGICRPLINMVAAVREVYYLAWRDWNA